MATSQGPNVCQLEDEVSCTHNSECPGDQVCASDLQCRDQCASEKDCVSGQQCIDSVCVEPAELTAEGTLLARTPEEGVRCTYATECPGDLVCLNGVCAIECFTDKDCFISWSCRTVASGGDGRCYPPGGQLSDGGPPLSDGSTDAGPTDGGPSDGGQLGPIVQLSFEAGCAVLQGGRVKCWNYDDHPELPALPEFVPELTNVVQVVGTQQRRYALLADGSVRYFGLNERTDLSYTPNPSVVVGAAGITRIVGYSPEYAYTDDELVLDQLLLQSPTQTQIYAAGDAQTSDASAKYVGIARILGLHHALLQSGDVRDVQAGFELGLSNVIDAAVVAWRNDYSTVLESVCAVRGNGELLCWGGDPSDAGIGRAIYLGGSEPLSSTRQPPTIVDAIPNAVQVVSNGSLVSVRRENGEVWDWCNATTEVCGHGQPVRASEGDGVQFLAKKLLPAHLEGGYAEIACVIDVGDRLLCSRSGTSYEQLAVGVVDGYVVGHQVYFVTQASELKTWYFGADVLVDIPL